MTASVKMSSKNQIVVPREAREILGLRPGDRLLVSVQADVIHMRREPRNLTVELEGLLADPESDAELWPEARGE